MSDAIIFVPPGPEVRRWLRACAEHCARRGYAVVAVVSDWADVVQLLRDGDAPRVVVVGRRDQLPANRPWRIEAVNEQSADDAPEHRRPRRQR